MLSSDAVLAALPEAQPHNWGAFGILNVAHDSRRVSPGDLFVAVPGVAVDGHHYVPNALGAGAVAVVVERLLPELVDALEDRDPAVRMFASVALRKLTGKDFGFKPHGSPAEREEAIRQWRVWIARDQTPQDVAPSPDEPEPAEPDGDEAEQTATARRADG